MAFSARTHTIPVDAEQAPSWVSEISIAQYFQVATLTILVYDTLITMDMESKYFWKVPQKSSDLVYFANRYLGIFGAIAHLLWSSYKANLILCNFSQWANDITAWIIIILIDYILMIRVLALYSQDRRLSLCLRTLLVFEALFKITMTIYLDYRLHIGVGVFSKEMSVCGYRKTLPWQWGLVDWLIPMLYGVILLVLALRKSVKYWRSSSEFRGTLVKALIQDQILYFALAVFCFVLSILSFRVSSAFLSNVLSSLGNPNLLSLVGSRLLFNLKEAMERNQGDGASFALAARTSGDIVFAEPWDTNHQREFETEDLRIRDSFARYKTNDALWVND